MSPGATFERVYHALKAELGSGRFRPGDHLEPATLSGELNASITPVRDALHRLVGEGLVEAPRSDGFRMPMLTEVALRHLYAWNQWLLLGALRSREQGHRPAVPREVEGVPALESLFLAIAALTRNPEHVEAVAKLNGRLRPVRMVEEMILDAVEDEAVRMRQRLLEDVSTLKRVIADYHRRRLRAAAEIVAQLHRGE